MWLQAASLSYLGIFFGISVVIGQSCGGYLDGRLHTTPWLRMLGVLLGLAAGFKELYRIVKRYQRSLEKDKANGPPAEATAPPVPGPTERPESSSSKPDSKTDAETDPKAEKKSDEEKDAEEKDRDAARNSWV